MVLKILTRLVIFGIIFIAFFPFRLLSKERESPHFKWVTARGKVTEINDRYITILDSSNKLIYAEIGFGYQRIRAEDISSVLDDTVSITGMLEWGKWIDAVKLESKSVSHYRYKEEKDTLQAAKLGISLSQYQTVAEKNGYIHRNKICRSFSVYSFIWGICWLTAGAIKYREANKVDPDVNIIINGDRILGFSFTLGGSISIGRGVLLLISSIVQKKKQLAVPEP